MDCDQARTPRSRHSIFVQVASNGVGRLALGALPQYAGHEFRLAASARRTGCLRLRLSR